MSDRPRDRLLVVAGEASGDLAASAALGALRRLRGATPAVSAIGGAGVLPFAADTLADLRDLTAMGVGELAPRAAGLVRAFARVRRLVVARAFDAALLVGFSEFNTRLVPGLARAGIPVVFYGAPQVWAWRAGRMKQFAKMQGKLAVILPFEQGLWRSAGVDAHYVGHPASEAALAPRSVVRQSLGLTPSAPAVAIMPGSRPHEVRALLPTFLAAYERARRDRATLDARVIVAPSLDRETAAWAIGLAREAHAPHVVVDATTGATPLLPAFDVALTASGTASLEAAIAGAVPVVAYRVGVVTELAARALVKVENIALPNIVLGRRVFAEHVQREVEPKLVARSLNDAITRRAPLGEACDAVRDKLGPERPSLAVARLVADVLDR